MTLLQVSKGDYAVQAQDILDTLNGALISGGVKEFKSTGGFQFDEIIYLEQQLEFLSPFTSGVYMAEFWNNSFFVENIIDASDSNFGYVFSINNNSVFEIVNNSSNDPTQFLYSLVPLWLASPLSTPNYIQFDNAPEPAAPAAGRIRLYYELIGGNGYFNVKFHDGAKFILINHSPG